MINISCDCKSDCTSLGIAASLLIGIVTAILTFTGTITVAPLFLWVAFGIAVVYLAIVLFTSAFRHVSGRCGCKSLSALLAGILGTILTSVILLAISFAATSVLGAIITGALLTFFSLIFTSAACQIKCTADCNTERD